MDKYLIIMVTVLVATQVIRITQNAIQLYRQNKVIKRQLKEVEDIMRTQIYEHRSGLKVVPRDIVSDVEKILWDINPILSKRTVASIKESVRERLEKEGWTGEYRLDSSSRITISSLTNIDIENNVYHLEV